MAPIAGYAWDLDGDGEFDDATGATTSLTPSDDGSLTVAVRVTDALGHADVDGATVGVANAAPAVSFDGPGSIDLDGRAALVARVSDAGDDEQAVTVDWNDGTQPERVPLLLRSPRAGDVLAFHDYALGGPHSATVRSDDGDGGLGQATTGFAARAPNRVPAVGDATARTVTGQPVAIPLPAADADGDAVRVSVAAGPSHGAVEAVDRDVLDPLFVYTPSAGFEGTDAFTVSGSDGHGGTGTGTVTVTVAPIGGGSPSETPPAPGPSSTPAPGAPAPVLPVSPASVCAHGRLQLTDVYRDGKRVRISGVAPAAARGQAVAITFTATGRRVATAIVAPDLSFTATAPLPSRRLRSGNRARYVATVAGQRSGALKLARRLFLRSVALRGNRVTVAGQVVKPLARRRKDRAILLRITTSCASAASGRGEGCSASGPRPAAPSRRPRGSPRASARPRRSSCASRRPSAAARGRDASCAPSASRAPWPCASRTSRRRVIPAGARRCARSAR